MTRIRVLCVVLMLAGGALAQRWVTPDTTPFRYTRFDGEYFPGTGKVYFLGGRLGDLSTTGAIWSYDPATRAYANTGVAMPIPISNYDICLVRDMYNADSFGLYVIGGRQGSTGYTTDTIQVYYPKSNTVRELTTDQYPGRVNTYIPAALGTVVAGNKIYAMGGFNAQDYASSNLAYVFDPLASAGSRWTQLPNINSARAYVASATIDDTLVYVIGGDSAYPSTLVPVPRVERLNTRNTGAGWTRVSDLPMNCDQTRAYAFQRADSLLGFSRQIIVAGTGQWPAESANCHIYTVASDSWKAFPKLDSARRNHAGAYIPGTAGTKGVPGIWVWGGRKASDAWILPTPEYYALGLNVGVTKIDAPAGDVDSGAAVTPACSVYNYGAASATYKVRMKIGSTYTDSATVTDHAPGVRIAVTFTNWTASVPRGNYAVSCSTRCGNDFDQSNDKQTGTVTVIAHDVGVRTILQPSGTVDSGAVIVPACSVYNYGNGTEASYSVRMKIGASYDRTATVTGHAPATAAYVTFPSWTAGPLGISAVTCSTQLSTDRINGNDKMTGQVTVGVSDVGATAIVAPTGVVTLNQVVTPKAKVKNFGTNPSTFDVQLAISGGTLVYQDTETVTGLASGAEATVTFSKTWTATPVGNYTTVAWTMLSGDVNRANDTTRGSFSVTAGGGGGRWQAKTPMPSGAKPVKDGAWLTYDRGTGLVYASRGNKQHDFFSWNPVNDSWKALAPWLPGTEGKMPKVGSVGCASGNGIIYATKGNNKSGFYKYDAAANAWTQLEDVPLGLSNKKVKGGTGIVWGYKGSLGSPYLLKGYKNEFYRYDVAADLWVTLTPAPVGVNMKWDKGSWLAYDSSNSKIYAFKVKYMEFYSYNTQTDSWSAALSPMPIPGSAGSKKAKDGSCGTCVWPTDPRDTSLLAIYALKGGNTREWWRYSITSNTWAEKETIPTGMLKKKVKSGASVTTVPIAGDMPGTPAEIPALKGNKSNELWVYGPIPPSDFVTGNTPNRDGVAAEKRSLNEPFLTLVPNPLSGGFATLRYSLPGTGLAMVRVYDVTGRTVLPAALITGRTGSALLDLRSLPGGVYLLKAEGTGFATVRKLVVKR